MNNFRRNLFAYFGIALILCLVSFWIFLRTERISYYKSAIPEKLEVNHVVLEGDNSSLSNFIFGEACGGGVFKLSKSTIEAIKSERLDFFKDATQSRGIQSRGGKYIYPAWKKTPVPYTWTSEGAWTGLDCINGNNRLIRKITKTSELPGSYYTDLGNHSVVVLPELGFVIFTYAD
jgi:hypothetical protein